jgi:hypothetical protein
VKSPALAGLLRRPNVLPSTIQTKIELEIRRSTGLRVVPNAPATLRAVITVTDMKEGNYFSILRLALQEQVRVVRNGATFAGESWRSH